MKHLLVLFQESPVWRHRALAADLLIVLGRCLLVGERNRGGGTALLYILGHCETPAGLVPGISCLEAQGSCC